MIPDATVLVDGTTIERRHGLRFGLYPRWHPAMIISATSGSAAHKHPNTSPSGFACEVLVRDITLCDQPRTRRRNFVWASHYGRCCRPPLSIRSKESCKQASLRRQGHQSQRSKTWPRACVIPGVIRRDGAFRPTRSRSDRTGHQAADRHRIGLLRGEPVSVSGRNPWCCHAIPQDRRKASPDRTYRTTIHSHF